MYALEFIQDMAIVMIVAGLVTVLFHRFKQPVVLGYILAGFLIGPYMPIIPVVQDEDTIRILADIGIIFLIFSLGIQFSVRTLKEVGTTAVIASTLEFSFMLMVGFLIGHLFGWSHMDSLFLGAMLSITSTTMIVKTLADMDLMKAPFAQRIFGIQIIEDSLGMTLIALLTGLAVTGVVHVFDGVLAVARILIFVTMILVAGFIIVPKLIRYVSRFRSDEMLLITVLGLCFGVTFATVYMGHSMVLGAFLIGTIIGETREIVKIKIITEPVRDMFSAIFFVTIGMLIQPTLLAEYALPILVIAVAAIVGKIFIFTLGTFLAGNDAHTSLRIGSMMVPVGELSFIIASVGLALGVVSDFLYPIAVSVAALTIPLTPYLARNSESIIRGIDRITPRRLSKAMHMYYLWVSGLAERRRSTGMRLARKWIVQMALNVLMIAGIFLIAAYLERATPDWIPEFPFEDELVRAMYWLGAAILALPLYVATIRKMRAIGMLIGEISAVNIPAGQKKSSVETLVAHAILIAGIILLAFVTLVLGSAFLPPWNLMILLLLIVALVAWLSWRHLIRIYSRIQGALYETLSNEREAQEQNNRHSELSVMLSRADLDRIRIDETSPAARKLLSELQLRTQSGASVVAIERADTSIINPGPAEELLPGDTLMLIGTAEQIRLARDLLRGEAASK